MLVGADGADSFVRALMSPGVETVYTGANGLEISLAPVVVSSAALADVVAATGVFALGSNNLMLASQVDGDGRVRTCVSFRES